MAPDLLDVFAELSPLPRGGRRRTRPPFGWAELVAIPALAAALAVALADGLLSLIWPPPLVLLLAPALTFLWIRRSRRGPAYALQGSLVSSFAALLFTWTAGFVIAFFQAGG